MAGFFVIGEMKDERDMYENTPGLPGRQTAQRGPVGAVCIPRYPAGGGGSGGPHGRGCRPHSRPAHGTDHRGGSAAAQFPGRRADPFCRYRRPVPGASHHIGHCTAQYPRGTGGGGALCLCDAQPVGRGAGGTGIRSGRTGGGAGGAAVPAGMVYTGLFERHGGAGGGGDAVGGTGPAAARSTRLSAPPSGAAGHGGRGTADAAGHCGAAVNVLYYTLYQC